MLLSWLITFLASLSPQFIVPTTSDVKPTVYLIRHAEKDPGGTIGLNEEGWMRADCLTHVFGPSSPYNIGYIMTQKPYVNGSGSRSSQTVTALAATLNLTVSTSCYRDEHECAAEQVRAFKGPGNILICWQHGNLRKIMRDLGRSKFPKYPKGRNDVI